MIPTVSKQKLSPYRRPGYNIRKEQVLKSSPKEEYQLLQTNVTDEYGEHIERQLVRKGTPMGGKKTQNELSTLTEITKRRELREIGKSRLVPENVIKDNVLSQTIQTDDDRVEVKNIMEDILSKVEKRNGSKIKIRTPQKKTSELARLLQVKDTSKMNKKGLTPIFYKQFPNAPKNISINQMIDYAYGYEEKYEISSELDFS